MPRRRVRLEHVRMHIYYILLHKINVIFYVPNIIFIIYYVLEKKMFIYYNIKLYDFFPCLCNIIILPCTYVNYVKNTTNHKTNCVLL